VIHQENAGTAHARDAGIRRAEGEFVTFVDSDDWIEADALEALYQKQRETGADVVMGGHRELFACRVVNYRYSDIGASSALTHFFENGKCFLWGRLYRRALFDGCITWKTNYYEDVICNVQIFSRIKQEKIEVIPDIIYNYNKLSLGEVRQAQRSAWTSWREYPAAEPLLWIEKYLRTTQCAEKEWTSFYCFYYQNVAFFFKEHNKAIDKNGVKLLYDIYKRICYYKKAMSLYIKMLAPVLQFSMPVGKLYCRLWGITTRVKNLIKAKISSLR